jgi:hypothetical protein
MANDEPKRKRGRPPGKSDARTVTFKIPSGEYEFLEKIVRDRKRVGDSVNDAARAILMGELRQMSKNREFD